MSENPYESPQPSRPLENSRRLMTRASVIKSLTVVAIVAAVAYVISPPRADSWGAVRVGWLLLNFATIIALTILLVLWNDEFSDMPGRRIVLAVCVINWMLLAILIFGLLRFLFPA